jgi:hypothetical protein
MKAEQNGKNTRIARSERILTFTAIIKAMRIIQKQSLSEFIRKRIFKAQDLKVLVPYPENGELSSLLKTFPEEKGRIHLVRNNIRSIRGIANCDMAFCTPPKTETEMNAFLEELCLCRMLLKPDAKLYLLALNDERESVKECSAEKKDLLQEILLRAGFCKTNVHKLQNEQIICSGQRPSGNC